MVFHDEVLIIVPIIVACFPKSTIVEQDNFLCRHLVFFPVENVQVQVDLVAHSHYCAPPTLFAIVVRLPPIGHICSQQSAQENAPALVFGINYHILGCSSSETPVAKAAPGALVFDAAAHNLVSKCVPPPVFSTRSQAGLGHLSI